MIITKNVSTKIVKSIYQSQLIKMQTPAKDHNYNDANMQRLNISNIKTVYCFARLFKKPYEPLSKQVRAQKYIERQIASQAAKKKQTIKVIDDKKPLYTFLNIDQDLKTYQKYLQIHNSHTKKAHQKLVRSQEQIIDKIIELKRQDLLITFLQNNKKNRLCSVDTIPKIIQYFQQAIINNNKYDSNYNNIQKSLNITILLSQYGEFQSFQKLIQKLNIKFNLDQKSSQYLIQIVSKIPEHCHGLFIYNFLLYKKQLPQNYLQKLQNVQLLLKSLKSQKNVFAQKFLKRYLDMYKKSAKKQPNDQKQARAAQKAPQRSVIQHDIQCFLKVLGYKTVKRQQVIQNFMVDYLIQDPRIPSCKPLILQVMGSYHYTINDKLRSKDISRFILLGSKYRQIKYSIRLVHHHDYNRTQGHRNKQALLKNLIQKNYDVINWMPQYKGFNSNWQLTQSYDEFK